MAGYQKPGILVTEVDTPNTTIVLDRPTVVGLIGQARGNEVRSEVIRLTDNDPVALTGANAVTTPAESFVVRDINSLNTVYSSGSVNDYTLTTNADGITSIKRSLYTTVTSTEDVVAVVKTTGPSAVVTSNVSFNYNNTSGVVSVTNGGTVAVTSGAPGALDVSIQRAGAYSITTDYTVNLANGRITRANATYGPNSSDCRIMSGQNVYVSYTTDNGANTYTDEIVTLTGTSVATLANDGDGVDVNSIIVRNKSGMGLSTATVSVFTAGTNGSTGVDFQFGFSPSDALATAFTMVRNTSGPTTMGLANNSADIRVDYTYIPENYYDPTLFTSYHDVETKYGPAFDSNGLVANSLSAAAYMCFRSGSNEIIAQPLFTSSDGVKTQGTESNTDHWTETLANLNGQTAINVLVPAVGQNDSISDSTMQSIQLKFVDHINFMQQENEYIIALFGEDSTSNGTVSLTKANTATLRDHAQILGNQLHPERTVLISPSSFKISNPVTGRSTLIGGQYAAAALAGMLGNNPVQASMTRKPLVGFSDVGIFKNESEKNDDASSGLLVMENKNGVVRVRHAITTNVSDEVKRELNAMRSKFFMIESVKNTLDTNVIGRVLSDGRAPFIVGTQVTSVLEFLRGTGAIANYSNVSATTNPSSPTSMAVRFTYSLPFAINNIEIVLALDSNTGTITAQ
jgi:hypothetical protein